MDSGSPMEALARQVKKQEFLCSRTFYEHFAYHRHGHKNVQYDRKTFSITYRIC